MFSGKAQVENNVTHEKWPQSVCPIQNLLVPMYVYRRVQYTWLGQ